MGVSSDDVRCRTWFDHHIISPLKKVSMESRRKEIAVRITGHLPGGKLQCRSQKGLCSPYILVTVVQQNRVLSMFYLL
ncbi:hypothetical protein GDO81_013098 [Engystomops pustulosus]|uniref:Uncharacterized protein n=1 Tax=Engystomops pustulosus TaxID=76066 RepID=A0AAV7AX28_ENGPU|nr:hypothetical protein GDO81_013098 [Engystomops pustulosus]